MPKLKMKSGKTKKFAYTPEGKAEFMKEKKKMVKKVVKKKAKK